MNNQNIKLNPKIWSEDIETESTRKGFGDGLVALGEVNKDVVALCADLTNSTQMNFFKERFPERFVEIGVAEQNMASLASGMAGMGKIPVIGSYAVFSPGRNWEQIRTTICYNNRQVIIAGCHAGFSTGPDGGTHQALEDIALTRVLPNMIVVSPCDYFEAKKAIVKSVETKKPFYLRISKEKTPIITTEENYFEIGKASLLYGHLYKGDVLIISTGPITYTAIQAARTFEEENPKIKIKVLNLSTIKPLDEKMILDLVKETKCLVTVEEHQMAGGMGSAVSEFLASNFSVPIEFVAVKDKFGQSGKSEELLKHYGLTKSDIIEAINKVLKRK